MSECERSESMVRDGLVPDDRHARECRDCSDASIVHLFFQQLAVADDLSPSLPDPKMLLIRSELMRGQRALSSEGQKAEWAGIAIWLTIATSWLVMLTWKMGEIRDYLEGLQIFASLPGTALSTAILATAIGGLVAFTVFAVAVHSVLVEL